MTTNALHSILNSFNPKSNLRFDLDSFNAILSTLTTLRYPIINATAAQIIYNGPDGDYWIVTPDGISTNQSTGEIKMGEV